MSAAGCDADVDDDKSDDMMMMLMIRTAEQYEFYIHKLICASNQQYG